jgi:uncharacterized protein YdeI (YjbR/CyaY-like superfamily)
MRLAAEWRDWLQNHHTSETKSGWCSIKRKRPASLSYLDTLDEALCVGWIDSLIKKLDGARYARKFHPRRTGTSGQPSIRPAWTFSSPPGAYSRPAWKWWCPKATVIGTA